MTRALVLNTGSSSLKCVLYEVSGAPPASPPPALFQSQAEWHEGSGGIAAATAELLRRMPAGPIDVVGHRVVHGGARFRESVIIDDEVRAAIEQLAELAPLHNPLARAAIGAIDRLLPAIPQVAVFDTAFHSTLPPAAFTYPGPREWLDRGIRKYGFHGISHQYVSRRAAEVLGRDLDGLRIITAHLGGGCSLCAVRAGRSVETTMGFTPLDGLMMGTRSGAVDPGILLHLLRHEGTTPAALDRTLQHESGLAGLSGVSSDMRAVLAARDAGDERARLAVDVFVHRLVAGIAALIPSLGGLDALVFTAGIGENAAVIRRAACARLAPLGVHLDDARDVLPAPDRIISPDAAPVAVLVIRTEESWAIARECARLVAP